MNKRKIIFFPALAVLITIALFNTPEAFANASTPENEYDDEIRYGGSAELSVTTQTFTFDQQVVSEDCEIKYGLPDYRGDLGSSCCANVAGAILIGYYDRFNENLIPNYKTYKKFGSNLTYKSQDDTINTLISDLRKVMQGNGQGATFSEFTAGMTTFVKRAGYSYTQQSVMKNNSPDPAKIKSAIAEDKPVALFLINYTFIQLQESGSTLTVTNATCNITHVLACYGYKEIKYYYQNKLVYTAKLLKIESGLTSENYKFASLTQSSFGNAVSAYVY